MARLFLALVIGSGMNCALAAGGAWDGIYQCNFSAAGQHGQQFLTINGQPDGRAVMAVVAVNQYTAVNGYGIGHVSGNQFNGTTMHGQPFQMSGTAYGFEGSFEHVVSGKQYTVTVDCTKIW